MQKNIKILSIFVVLLILALFSSCSKDNSTPDFDCYLFQKGIAQNDETLVKPEMEKLMADLSPKPSLDDEHGHQENIKILVARLNSQCQGQLVEEVCYACIETYPPQSELLVKVTFEGTQYQQVFDILTSDEKPLEFAGMHD